MGDYYPVSMEGYFARFFLTDLQNGYNLVQTFGFGQPGVHVIQSALPSTDRDYGKFIRSVAQEFALRMDFGMDGFNHHFNERGEYTWTSVTREFPLSFVLLAKPAVEEAVACYYEFAQEKFGPLPGPLIM